MRMFVIVALCIVWLAMAYREYQAGDMMLAGVFVLAGDALTSYRVMKWRG